MKTYRIVFTHVKRGGEELDEIVEAQRPRFTNELYRDVILPNLLYFAGLGYEYSMMTACVSCDGERRIVFRCDTKVDGSTIRSLVSAARPGEKFRHIRTAVLAQ